MDTERRALTVLAMEVRESDDRGPLIAGHAAVFNSPSLDLGGFREIVAPGAFTRSLKSRGTVIKSFYNHDANRILGRTDNKTLSVTEDDKGLSFEVAPPDTTWARDLLVSIKRGDVRDASFAFRVKRDSWRTDEKGVQERTLLDVDLFELGPVTNGAYPAADAQVRSMLEARGITLDAIEPTDSDERAAPDMPAMMAKLDATMSKMDDMMGTMSELMDQMNGGKKSMRSEDSSAPMDEESSWQIAAGHRQRTLRLLQAVP